MLTLFNMVSTLRDESMALATSPTEHRYYQLNFIVFRILTISTAASADDSIIPSLLERARSITKEHSELSKQLGNAYDAKVAKKVGELAPIVSALQLWEKANEVSSAGPSNWIYAYIK